MPFTRPRRAQARGASGIERMPFRRGDSSATPEQSPASQKPTRSARVLRTPRLKSPRRLVASPRFGRATETAARSREFAASALAATRRAGSEPPDVAAHAHGLPHARARLGLCLLLARRSVCRDHRAGARRRRVRRRLTPHARSLGMAERYRLLAGRRIRRPVRGSYAGWRNPASTTGSASGISSQKRIWRGLIASVRRPS